MIASPPAAASAAALPCTLAMLLLALSGCADAVADAPSLAPRPIERLTTAEPAAPPVAAPAVDPAAPGRYAAILADARSGDAAFERELVGTKAAAARARGVPTGSDAWIAAQEAVTRLDAARAPVGTALAALDAERTAGPFDPAALDAAVAQADAIDTRERQAVAALAAALQPRR